MTSEGEWVECFHCGGSGQDSSMWDGRCPFCHGHGDVWIELRDDDDDADDEGEW